MAYIGGPGIDVGTRRAIADLSGHQFRCVKFDAGGVNVVDHAWDRPDGVLLNNPKAGQAAVVRIVGIPKAVASAIVAVGDRLIMDEDGKVAPAPQHGGFIVGTALSDATAADQVVTFVVDIEPQCLIVELLAGANLSAAANLFKLVEVDNEASSVNVCNNTADVIRGVLLNRPADNGIAKVGIAGILPVRANAALTLGAAVGTSTDGEGAGASGTNPVIGIVIVAASAAGDTAVVLASGVYRNS